MTKYLGVKFHHDKYNGKMLASVVTYYFLSNLYFPPQTAS